MVADFLSQQHEEEEVPRDCVYPIPQSDGIGRRASLQDKGNPNKRCRDVCDRVPSEPLTYQMADGQPKPRKEKKHIALLQGMHAQLFQVSLGSGARDAF